VTVIIAVWGASPGIGKSTLCAGLAGALPGRVDHFREESCRFSTGRGAMRISRPTIVIRFSVNPPRLTTPNSSHQRTQDRQDRT
jgi:hypothetical protein